MDLYVLIYMCLEPCIPTTLDTFIQFLKNLFLGGGGMLQVLWELSSSTRDQT